MNILYSLLVAGLLVSTSCTPDSAEDRQKTRTPDTAEDSKNTSTPDAAADATDTGTLDTTEEYPHASESSSAPQDRGAIAMQDDSDTGVR